MSRKKSKNSLSTFVNTILTIFGENPFKPMNYKQIAKIMSVRDAAGKDVIYQILVTLFNEGKLIEDRPYRLIDRQVSPVPMSTFCLSCCDYASRYVLQTPSS